MNWKTIVWCLLLLVTAGTLALAGDDEIQELERKLKKNPNDIPSLLALGRLYHDKVGAGDGSVVEKAFACFDRLLAVDSANAVALAYRGSLWTFRAREAWWPPTKLKYLKQGREELDRAVAQAPDNMMVRLLRGINSLSFSGGLERLEVALEDFTLLLKHPELPDQTRELKVAIYFYGGVAYKRAREDEKAKQLLEKAIILLPDSDFARRARQELKDLE